MPVEWFRELHPIWLAFPATCFTWGMTALGASAVFRCDASHGVRMGALRSVGVYLVSVSGEHKTDLRETDRPNGIEISLDIIMQYSDLIEACVT